MKPYSEDLRKKIVAAVERGMSKTEAARTFGVSLSSVKRYWRLAAHEESLAPRKSGGRPPKANKPGPPDQGYSPILVERLYEKWSLGASSLL